SVVFARISGLDSTSRESRRFACSPSVTLGTGTRGRRRRQPSDAETARLKARLPQKFFTGAAFPLIPRQRWTTPFGSLRSGRLQWAALFPLRAAFRCHNSPQFRGYG